MFKLPSIPRICRGFCTQTSANLPISENFVNRNPRNLERMRIGYKPDGYHLEKPGRCYWHKLNLRKTGRYIYATIDHFENGTVVKASTSEWALKKQLYKCRDTSAFYNLGRVLAERCLKFGLIEIRSDIVPPKPDGKVAQFLQALQEGGVVLQEPPQFKPARPWDQLRLEKPWEVTE
ncbi:large ribosomal subunit protein uL18m [Tribolium castaneum]|uniref:Large ribosomal subunit protein uL18m n=1 Tax=Tribolium castaneum TaxID=7070 RepID=A0A139WGG4_TRICA|nr:PREDICTED: 39S ribosomal protein L18, mitochondrial [Tribolium castaneum]KYB27088.1 39S ribosomal protein L18, mitochondrial-like Protein [Tribolium castaneum]|eukprot:XP_971220.3 PREDICTED: 39S ribosomal protein L18, mitochondrial [Tribolium castaneum]